MTVKIDKDNIKIYNSNRDWVSIFVKLKLIPMNTHHYIAVDLGATSGRTILGTIDQEGLKIKELNRFPNKMIEVGGHYFWNIFSLYDCIKEGLRVAAREKVTIDSIGIDTWGVDFVFVGDDGTILGLPYAYRDPHTFEASQRFFEKEMSRDEVYRRTGIQFLNFNSLYQLYALKESSSSLLKAASKVLFIPDALSYMLTGNMVTEYTIASTSQLLDVHKRDFDKDLLQTVRLTDSNFAKMVMPGTVIGTLREDIAKEVGLPCLPVVAVAGHDTASAVAAVPAQDRNFAYLSSGTWSLMGIEVESPIVSESANRNNITNEGGVDGSIRFLKNITGMWILEQCIKMWKLEGKDFSYPELVAMAESAPAFERFIDPDDSSFVNPANMLEAIDAYCRRTNQPVPTTDAEYVRLIFESLAMKYRMVLDVFQSYADFPIERLHIIGGGSRNRLLSQMTANSIGKSVVAGPAEATAIGNIMIQAWSKGVVSSLSEMRKMIAEAVQVETFMPNDVDRWDRGYAKFKELIK